MFESHKTGICTKWTNELMFNCTWTTVCARQRLMYSWEPYQITVRLNEKSGVKAKSKCSIIWTGDLVYDAMWTRIPTRLCTCWRTFWPCFTNVASIVWLLVCSQANNDRQTFLDHISSPWALSAKMKYRAIQCWLSASSMALKWSIKNNGSIKINRLSKITV